MEIKSWQINKVSPYAIGNTVDVICFDLRRISVIISQNCLISKVGIMFLINYYKVNKQVAGKEQLVHCQNGNLYYLIFLKVSSKSPTVQNVH